MLKGMIVNLDHVSSKARRDMRVISREFGDYPLNALHNNPNTMLMNHTPGGQPPFRHEYDFDDNELDMIKETRGFFGVRVGPLDAREDVMGSVTTGVEANCPGTATETAKILAYLLDYDDGLPVGYALDFATVTEAVHSRTFEGCTAVGEDRFHTYGEHVAEGLSHVGMMKKWHRELQDVGLRPEYLRQLKNDGVEQFIRMWARSEAKSSEGTQIPRQVFGNDLVDGRTCEEDSNCRRASFARPASRAWSRRGAARSAMSARSVPARISACRAGAPLACARGRTNARATPIVHVASSAATRSPGGAAARRCSPTAIFAPAPRNAPPGAAPGVSAPMPTSAGRARTAAAASIAATRSPASAAARRCWRTAIFAPAAAQCATGRCAWGFCADADECQASSDCGSGQYCGDPIAGKRTCKTLLAHGALCTSAAQCATGRCAWGFCADADECQASSDCGRGQYCGDPIAGKRTLQDAAGGRQTLHQGHAMQHRVLQAAHQRRRRPGLPPGRPVLSGAVIVSCALWGGIAGAGVAARGPSAPVFG